MSVQSRENGQLADAAVAHARGAPRELISKAMTAFLVAHLARVDEEYMDLDGPTIIYTCCHSALVARAATGAPTVRVCVYRCVIGGTFDEVVRSISGRPAGSATLIV